MQCTLCSLEETSFQLVQGSITEALRRRDSTNVRWQSLDVRPRPRLTPFAPDVEVKFFLNGFEDHARLLFIRIILCFSCVVFIYTNMCLFYEQAWLTRGLSFGFCRRLLDGFKRGLLCSVRKFLRNLGEDIFSFLYQCQIVLPKEKYD